MDTEQIRVAVAVARHGSFTGAALRLYMAQSTVSRHVAALERELGVPLFVRGPRRVVPTAAGEGFLIAAQEVLTDLERAVTDARRTRSDAQAS